MFCLGLQESLSTFQVLAHQETCKKLNSFLIFSSNITLKITCILYNEIIEIIVPCMYQINKLICE